MHFETADQRELRALESILAACLTGRLPESSPARACHLPEKRRRSCRLIPILAVFEARDWPRLLLFARSAFRARKPRRFLLPVGALRFRDRLPDEVVCRRLLRARRS